MCYFNLDQYPIGDPCRGCPYVLEYSLKSCMFPHTKGKCFMQRQKESRIKAMNPKQKKRLEATKRIFKFIDLLERVKKRKGYVEGESIRSQKSE